MADASRRLRIEPLVAEMQSRGIDVHVHELLSSKAFARKNGSIADRLYAMSILLTRIFSRLFFVLRSCDILLVHREAFPFFTPELERFVTKKCAVSILDVDDAIYTIPTHTRDWRRLFRKPEKSLEFSKLFDLIFCGNEMLQDSFGSNRAIAELYPTCPPSQTFDITRKEEGKMGLLWTGSQSTLGSLKAVMPDVLRICEEKDLQLYVLGGANVSELQPHPRLSPARWSNEAEQELLGIASIGLMPLPDTEWERGKSGYKAILYLCAGMHALVSPVGINRKLCDEYTAVTACAEPDWASSLRNIVEEISHSKGGDNSQNLARLSFDSSANAVRAVDTIIAKLEQTSPPSRS